MKIGRAFLICSILLAASGCHRAATTAETAELTVWTMWSGPEEQNFRRVVAAYARTHPKVKIRNLGAVNDDAKTLRAIVAGVPPDLCTLSDPAYLGPLARNHALLPLDERFRASGLQPSAFVSTSLELCRYQGQLYALPFLIDDAALLWNRDALAQAGLDAAHGPRTLDELGEWAARLTTRNAEGRITRLGLRPPADIYLLFALFGGKFVDATGKRVTTDDPANVAALTWYKNLIDRMGGIEAVNAFAAGFGRDQGASNPFFVGKVAMMFNGEWNPNWVSRYAPKLRYGVAPAPPPQSRPDRARTTWLGGNLFCIPKESRHPDAAWDFLVWMQSQSAQTGFARDMNNVPNQRAALHAPELRTGADFRAQYARFLDLADSPNADYFPTLPVAGYYMNQMSTAIDRVLYGEKTVPQALGDVRRRMQTELDRQGDGEGRPGR